MLLRLDGIGDALACTPLVAALRDAGHELGALLTTRNCETFAPKTFKHIHVVERVSWPRHGMTPDSRASVLREVAAACYDVALVASEEMDALQLARDARIPVRRGFVNGWEKPFKTVLARRLLSAPLVRTASAGRVSEHEVETLFRLGAGLHSETAPTRDIERLRPLVYDEPVQYHGRIVVQVSRKFAERGLDLSAYVALLTALRSDFDPALFVSDDRNFAAQLSRAGSVDVEQPPGASAWKRWIAGAQAVVTPDSGASNLAGMLGVPSVVAFADGPAVSNDILRWKPWAAPSRTFVIAPGAEARTLAKQACHELDVLLGYAKTEGQS